MTTGSAALAEVHRLHPIRVLVVSPDVSWAFAVREVLEGRGCVAALGHDARHAVDDARRLRPHVAIVDMTGAEADNQGAVTRFAEQDPMVGVVVVDDRPGRRQDPGVHDKWTTPGELYGLVEAAYHHRPPRSWPGGRAPE